jgi:hypothetical protein
MMLSQNAMMGWEKVSTLSANDSRPQAGCKNESEIHGKHALPQGLLLNAAIEAMFD